jgi:6-phosphogluconolactonase
MSVEIEIVEDPARACAAMMVGAAAGGGHVVVAGGSTPRAAYEEFVEAVGAVGVDLRETTLWFGDERCVPPDDERSNYLMVKKALLDPLGEGAPAAVYRMPGELGPGDAADAYEQDLQDHGPSQFDLVVLGIGPDGHTASLFPGQATLDERERLVVGVPEAGLEPFVPRVSMTLTGLARTRQVVFLISGESKAPAVARAFGAEAAPDRQTPASMVAPLADEVVVLLDPAAAAEL